MATIVNPNYNSLPQQVQQNTNDIKSLQNQQLTIYMGNAIMSKNDTMIDISNTNIPSDETEGYLLSTNALLFKIVTISKPNVYLQFYSDLQGPQGIQGKTGETGPQGPKGDTGPKGEQGIGFNFMGAWVSGNEYFKNDVVTYTNPTTLVTSSYCLIDEEYTGGTVTPDKDTTHWLIFTAGTQGPQGPQGPQGLEGSVLNFTCYDDMLYQDWEIKVLCQDTNSPGNTIPLQIKSKFTTIESGATKTINWNTSFNTSNYDLQYSVFELSSTGTNQYLSISRRMDGVTINNRYNQPVNVYLFAIGI